MFFTVLLVLVWTLFSFILASVNKLLILVQLVKEQVLQVIALTLVTRSRKILANLLVRSKCVMLTFIQAWTRLTICRF